MPPRKFLDIVKSLVPFHYNDSLNTYMDYNTFSSKTVNNKSSNDKNNKMRENIVGAIINKKVPIAYYELYEWSQLLQSINEYIKQLTENKPYTNIECIHKGNRLYHYDFIFKITYDDNLTSEYNIELKRNKSPQFVSPSKPSMYITHTDPDMVSFELYYFTYYLPKLGLPMPTKEEYIEQINTPNPECMMPYQTKYYNGCDKSSKYTGNQDDIDFYKRSNEISSNSIERYIESAELDTEKLSEYLNNTQKDKIYMIYNGGRFILEKGNIDYTIETVVKNPKRYRYECICKNGLKINVLLRWKNGNGIAFPALQIS